MKVLIAHNRYRSALPSGENAVVDDDIRVLRESGIEVVPLIENSDDIPGLGTPGKLGVAVGPLINPAGVARMRKLLQVHKPDVVHVHNVFPLLSPWIIRTAHAAGVPVVQTVHNFRQECVAGSFFRDGQVCTECTGMRVATPAVAHGCYRGSRAQTVPMVIGRSAHRGTWLSVDRYFVLTEFHADYMRALGVPDERIVIRPTSMKDPGPGTEPGRDVLFVGRLDPEKGVGLLLDAWAANRHETRRLVIAGDGPLRDLVADRAAADPSIDFIGRLDSAGVLAAMTAAGVVVLPSVWLEGLPRTAIESMALGRPLMAVNHGGLATVVSEDNGWLLPPTVASWAQALGRLTSTQLCRRGEAARRTFTSRFDQTVTTRQLLAGYNGLLAA